ncbi:MAG: hypothetical protein ABH882_06980 [Candidatus Omnitrophota bacterium]
MKKYDLGWLILSPDFYMSPKIRAINQLDGNKTVEDYFEEINDTMAVLSEEEAAVCYDLTHSLGNFFNYGDTVKQIDSMKKIGRPGDFAISRLRSYLKEMAIIPSNSIPQLFSTEYVIYRAKNLNTFSEKSLFVFCLSNQVQTILKYSQYGTEHPRFYEFVLNSLPIPQAIISLNEILTRIINNALMLNDKSNNLYSKAEQILLSELGFLNWEPNHSLSFIKNFSDTQASERIDAEYFQPMYEEIVKRIKQYKNGCVSLDKIVKIKDRNFQPKDEVTYRYIELANISANGNINGCIETQGRELPTRARRKVNVGDVIVSTIEGALSSIALITEDLDNGLCSTGFFVITSEKTNSETLLVLLKSPIGQLQLKKGCSGTILTAIGDDEFKRIVLPDLPANIQKDIKNKIIEMYNAKALSKRLLDIAKCGAEMAIEKNGKDAQVWIEAELKRLSFCLD